MPSEFKTYGVEYGHAGAQWVLHIEATSEQDARDRLRQAYYNGEVLGTLEARIPASRAAFGLIPRLLCWWKNRTKGKVKDA